MTATRKASLIILSLLAATLTLPFFAYAQTSQTLSVTPPLFQLSIAPGDVWQSSVKVVNGNPYELTVYAEVVNFRAKGERGQGTFVPILSDDTTSTLAEWIEIAEGPHVIGPEESKDISFFVDVPEDAPPGGHFAAILIGTQPQGGGDDPLIVQTTQTVTSLFFVRIEGDIIEAANIREFSTKENFVETPSADFVLRFENKGNVHLQPRGDIIITNMWGSERGVIPINRKTHFGNVLPLSIREFRFAWEGERSITELGRYKAVVTLAYGENGIQSTSATTYFWVIPVKATLITLGTIIGFIIFVAWAMRLYVRRMLVLAGVDVHVSESFERGTAIREEKKKGVAAYRRTFFVPIKNGVRDLKQRMQNATEIVDAVVTLFGFVRTYRVFFGSVLVIGIGFVGTVLYISEASKESTSFEVTIERDDGEVTVNSEEILKDRLSGDRVSDINPDQHFALVLVNESGESGAAATLSLVLEDEGYSVTELVLGERSDRNETLILYDSGLLNEAEAIVSTLGVTELAENAGVMEESGDDKPTITIFIGEDVLK